MAVDLYTRCVRDVMKCDVTSIGPQDTVHDALVLFVDKRISALPVVNRERRCIGMLSVTDLTKMMRELVEELSDPTRINAVLMKWLNKNVMDVETDRCKVAALMTDEVVSVTCASLVTDAARLMVQHRVHRLPVLDEEQHLVGIVSTMDILRALAGCAE